MAQVIMKLNILLLVVFALLISTDIALAAGQGNGNGNSGSGNSGNGKSSGSGNNGNGNGNNGTGGNSNSGGKNGNGNNNNQGGNNNSGGKNGDGNNNNKGDQDDFYNLPSEKITGQEKGICRVLGTKCIGKSLICPAECPQKKPVQNKKQKACYFDCRKNCEATCKWRKARCEGYGSLCYDPRFVGGDGVMFYFHGAKGGNFAIVSDDNLQINAHFIGTRPQGRTRDFTWVQALAVMFDSHGLVIAAKRVTSWDDNIDSLTLRWDGEDINIPTGGEAEWRHENSQGREVVVERIDDVNSVRVRVSGLVEMDVSVKPIGKRENEVHKYMLPDDDAFAHLETQFRFKGLSDQVEGVLGKTYRPDYVSPVKVGVPMPMVGGEDRYLVPSLLSSTCRACRFQERKEEGVVGVSSSI